MGVLSLCRAFNSFQSLWLWLCSLQRYYSPLTASRTAPSCLELLSAGRTPQRQTVGWWSDHYCVQGFCSGQRHGSPETHTKRDISCVCVKAACEPCVGSTVLKRSVRYSPRGVCASPWTHWWAAAAELLLYSPEGKTDCERESERGAWRKLGKMERKVMRRRSA